MSPKAERTFLFFLTLFLVVMLISNIVDYILDPTSGSILTTLCFAGGIICVIIAWIQHFRGNKDNE